ncbi:MAG: D-glycero-beta-D-manno-heptose 1,7-bisphosphate 7-phosphatase [Nitrococcus sp.]|nr:D-glycero-beta-D-manno-heptose 1,7-bisphosphate 7-phosphatase [Nitrococcus sp.]
MAQRLIVLDRDGVINWDSTKYIKSPAEWQPLPGSMSAIARLAAIGFDVVVCTNQSGIARGLLSRDDLSAIHARMDAAVRAAGGRLAAVFICPHGPDDGCACRKPKAGLLQAVEHHFEASLCNRPVVGDSARDLVAASRVGARAMLVRTGNGEHTLASSATDIAESYPNLAMLADHLIEEAEQGHGG